MDVKTWRELRKGNPKERRFWYSRLKVEGFGLCYSSISSPLLVKPIAVCHLTTRFWSADRAIWRLNEYNVTNGNLSAEAMDIDSGLAAVIGNTAINCDCMPYITSKMYFWGIKPWILISSTGTIDIIKIEYFCLAHDILVFAV